MTFTRHGDEDNYDDDDNCGDHDNEQKMVSQAPEMVPQYIECIIVYIGRYLLQM